MQSELSKNISDCLQKAKETCLISMFRASAFSVDVKYNDMTITVFVYTLNFSTTTDNKG